MAMNNILGLFAHSPLKPLQKHSDKVTECCDLLIPFFQHTFVKQWDDAEKTRLDISQCEREADSLKREIRLKLPRGLLLPIDRTDLLELVTQQDKLANYAKDIAGRMIGRQFGIPEEMQEEFHFSAKFFETCENGSSDAKRYLMKESQDNVFHKRWKLYAPVSLKGLIDKGVDAYDAMG